MSVWPQRADSPGGKPKENSSSVQPKKEFSLKLSMLKIEEEADSGASSLKAGEQGLGGHFVVVQRVDEGGPLAFSSHSVMRISGSMNYRLCVCAGVYGIIIHSLNSLRDYDLILYLPDS